MSRCNLQLNQHLRQTMAHRCQQMDPRILSWGLAAPALRALISLNVQTVEDILSYSKKEVADAHGMGPTALLSIEEGIQAMGMCWD